MHVLSLASVALAVAAGASAMMIPHRHTLVSRAEKPATYYEGYLENYQVYHTRYLALDCEAKHNTSFFDKCCHPMLVSLVRICCGSTVFAVFDPDATVALGHGDAREEPRTRVQPRQPSHVHRLVRRSYPDRR